MTDENQTPQVDPTDSLEQPAVTPVDIPLPDQQQQNEQPVSARQARYDELIRQGVSEQDALAQEAYEHKLAQDRGEA